MMLQEKASHVEPEQLMTGGPRQRTSVFDCQLLTFYMRAFGLRRAGNSRNDEVWFQNPLPSCHTLVRRKTLKCSFWISFWNHCHQPLSSPRSTCHCHGSYMPQHKLPARNWCHQSRSSCFTKTAIRGFQDFHRFFQVPFRLRCDPQQSQPLVGFAMKGPQQGQSHVEPEQQC